MHISHKPKCSYPLKFHPLFTSELNLTCLLVMWRRYSQNEGERGNSKGREGSSACIVSLQWVCAEEVNQIYIVIFAWQVQEGRPGDMLAALLTQGDITLCFCGCSSPDGFSPLTHLTKASTEDNAGGQGMSSEVPIIIGRPNVAESEPRKADTFNYIALGSLTCH